MRAIANQTLQTGRLSYYASLLPGKESQYQTPEGYRIYKNVPIARTGMQVYLGRELKKNDGYDPSWNIGDHQQVEVFRPFEEVTARETLASFEGKSVLDEHPAGDKVLIDALDEYEGYSKGHVQNVRAGERLPDGETAIVADLHIKNPDLNVKIDGGIRDVSCGYTFILAKDEAGRLIQTKIRGNHVAVVPKGRAGDDVAIGDAAAEVEPVFWRLFESSRGGTIFVPFRGESARLLRGLESGRGLAAWWHWHSRANR